MGTIETIMSAIPAMLHQEETAYATSNYFFRQQHNDEPEYCHRRSQGPLKTTIDADCRDMMATWCFQIVDFCKLDREVASIAISFMDRFMMSPASATARVDRADFQLTSMTCLYTAIKIHAPAALGLDLMSQLSHGVYSEEQIEAKELEILSALRWRVNPPTASAFVRELLCLLPENLIPQETLELVCN